MAWQTWFKKPLNLRSALWVILPLLFSQLLQRLYPIVDSRYVAALGQQPLLIHSLTYNFVAFGALIGMASATSCLIFWRRDECLNRQGSIFIKHILLATVLGLFILLPTAYFSIDILDLYKVSHAFLSIGVVYLYIALLNMLLQALYGAIDGMLIASGQQSKSMMISGVLLLLNILTDMAIIHWLYQGGHSPHKITEAMIAIGASTSALLFLGGLLGTFFVMRKIEHWHVMPYRDLLNVWSSEMGIYLIKGFIPFVYAYQLARVTTSAGFFATFQLSLQLAYVFCLPLLAATQIAVREASADLSQKHKVRDGNAPQWWCEFFTIGLLPTIFLLLVGAAFYPTIFRGIYNYVPATDQWAFIPLYFIGCLFGQIGNAVSIPIRARKASYMLTFNFFVNQLVIMIGFTQLLIWLNLATPRTVGWVTIIYCLSQLAMNAFSVRRLKRKESQNENLVNAHV